MLYGYITVYLRATDTLGRIRGIAKLDQSAATNGVIATHWRPGPLLGDSWLKKINETYSVLCIMKKFFIHMDESSFILLYKLNQWFDHIWNTQIQCGVHINKVISKSSKKSKKELLNW